MSWTIWKNPAPDVLRSEESLTRNFSLPRPFSRPVHSKSRWQRLTGWQFGVLGWISTVLTVFAINLGVAIWVNSHYGFSDGVGVLLQGECDKIGSYSTAAHLLINALSTLLLSGSNYCMQCLTAPTRAEVDKAHRQGIALEIGMPSLRNLRYIARWKALVWGLLVVSSLPLHLFYNSVVYSSLTAHSYVYLSVNEAFIQTPSINITNLMNSSTTGSPNNDVYSQPIADQLHAKALAGTLQRLDNADCIKQYGQTYLSARSNVLLVSTSQNQSAQIFAYGTNDVASLDNESNCALDPVAWMCQRKDCSNPCINRIQDLSANASTWSPLGHEVEYCLSETNDQACQLRFSLPIAITVISFNVMKFLLMLSILAWSGQMRLLTIGDAICSYLDKPDQTTVRSCLKNISDFQKPNGFEPCEKIFIRKRIRWVQSAGTKRWTLSLLFYSLSIFICLCLLWHGLAITATQNFSPSYLFSLALGAVSTGTVILWTLPTSGAAGFLSNVMMANFPQLILSSAYFTYNALFTSMLASHEWHKMATHRKGLRVSQNPKGDQRTTYFLQLPYRYAVPLLLTSGFMHWMVSQSLFLITVLRYQPDGSPLYSDPGMCSSYDIDCLTDSGSDFAHYTCGWSPVALVCVIIGGLLMIAVALGIGHGFRYAPGMPLGGTCSAVLAAACHPDFNESSRGGLEISKLQWGVVLEAREAFPENMKGDIIQLGEHLNHGSPQPFRENTPRMMAIYMSEHDAVPVGHRYFAQRGGKASSSTTPLISHSVGHCAFSSQALRMPREGFTYE